MPQPIQTTPWKNYLESHRISEPAKYCMPETTLIYDLDEERFYEIQPSAGAWARYERDVMKLWRQYIQYGHENARWERLRRASVVARASFLGKILQNGDTVTIKSTYTLS